MRERTMSVGARRTEDLSGYSTQITLRLPTRPTSDVANAAMELLRAGQLLDAEHAIRAICVRTTNLVPISEPVRLDLFGDEEEAIRPDDLGVACQ